ncbi:MAG: PH domain-containing protein [Natronomonas sp.]
MRLHPLSIPYRAGESVLRLAWVIILVAIGSPQVSGPAGIGVIVVLWFLVVLAYQLVYYQRFEYELTPETLDIVSGVVSRRHREIPLRRVQNVDISRNVVHRLAGIARIEFETAGGSSTEASLQYVSYPEAKRLESEIGRRKRREGSTDEPEEKREIFAITGTELGLLGLVGVDLRLLSIVAILLPVISPSLQEQFGDPLLGLAVTVPLLAIAIVAVVAAISGLFSIANYYGFRLRRSARDLHYERGLLQRYSGTIPLDKVQTLSISENLIARWLGYASLAVETAGYAPGEGGYQSAIPLAERERVLELGRSIESFGELDFNRPPGRARERYVIRYLAVAGIAIFGSYAVNRYTGLGFAWYATLGLLVIAPIAAHFKWIHLGYQIGDEYAVLREGFWTRTTTVVPYYRVQTVLDSQTIFQRRRRLATLVVDTAGTSGLTNRQPRALDIDDERAADIREDVADHLQVEIARRSEKRRADRLESIEIGLEGSADD